MGSSHKNKKEDSDSPSYAALPRIQLAKYSHTQEQERELCMARGTHEPTTKYNDQMEPLIG
jgi:hypothetical protein